ncbi:hypothetical protein VSDG_04878 [Cytospora chrysosperma]|uniref:Uncharacterized protein n=1 Tax=Cytospora chrysosperma TaxID=252740 RepID=A0A423W3Q8_CYTCH|nr:hypothetical protein VSDG_04878 [Valsa sordida]
MTLMAGENECGEVGGQANEWKPEKPDDEGVIRAENERMALASKVRAVKEEHNERQVKEWKAEQGQQLMMVLLLFSLNEWQWWVDDG